VITLMVVEKDDKVLDMMPQELLEVKDIWELKQEIEKNLQII
jgi:hypothetical protein